MPLTGRQAHLLLLADRKTGCLTDAERRELPGFHYCPDWDELPICEASPEWEACTCPKSIQEAI